jgi:hypothetical protein
MSLAVIGAGLGRTGTLSLKLALEQLGLGPCYHMKEVFEHLDAHVPLWRRAAGGDARVWDTVFDGYRSAVDFPAASFYRQLADYYPEAKVVLTMRDPERWYQSFIETIHRPLSGLLPDHLSDWGKMVRATILDPVFSGDVSDKDHVIECFKRHNDKVVRTVPSERLLVYEVSQGWAPLCKFLGMGVPETPFPKVNSTQEFKELANRFMASPST